MYDDSSARVPCYYWPNILIEVWIEMMLSLVVLVVGYCVDVISMIWEYWVVWISFIMESCRFARDRRVVDKWNVKKEFMKIK
eukprot:UN28293